MAALTCTNQNKRLSMSVHVASLCIFVLALCAFWIGRYVRVNRTITLPPRPPSHVRITRMTAIPRPVMEFDHSDEGFSSRSCVGPCCSDRDSHTT